MADDQNTNERRQCQRVDFTTQITLKTPSESYQLEGNSRDVSQNGIYINTDKNIPLDTVCEIDIALTGSIPQITLSITGKVVRKTKDGIGIEFKEMDLESYTHLKNIVKYNNKEAC